MCGHMQTTLGNTCERCSVQFARYHCAECNVWSNRDTVWHCSAGCGCRYVHACRSIFVSVYYDTSFFVPTAALVCDVTNEDGRM